MDIIIAGDQGAGKTTAAELLIKNFRPPYGKRYADNEVLWITDASTQPGHLIEMMRAKRCRAVVFDECLLNPTAMLNAVTAVKEYRKQINADVLAVYVAPGEAVMLTDGVPRTNEFKPRRDFVDSPRFTEDELMQRAMNGGKVIDTRDYMHKPMQNRTDRILADLWETVVDKADEAGRDQMEKYLNELVQLRYRGEGEILTPALHHLDSEGKLLLHEFLLSLLRKYE